MTSQKLPSFRNPPVVEVVLGVQFDPLPRFSTAHLGAFWKTLGPEWTGLEDVPPLPPQFERFTEGSAWQRLGLRLQLTDIPQTRLQIRHSDGARMIQIQNGRLHFNWLGQGGTEYPRYSRMLRPAFDQLLSEFSQFVVNADVGSLELNQWEVTYVNQIAKGSLWQTPEDWPHVFPRLLASQSLPGRRLESFGGEWHFVIEPARGRLHVRLQHARTEIGKEEVESVRMTMTARGGPESPEKPNIDGGLDLGHATIVQSFKDFTSNEAHALWEIEQ
jgi:uncharacterized protein (TIGR04255 family)